MALSLNKTKYKNLRICDDHIDPLIDGEMDLKTVLQNCQDCDFDYA